MKIMINKLLETIKKVIAEALEINHSEITDQSCMDNVGEWDSLGHLKIISALEKQFNIIFQEKDMIAMTSIKNIEKIIRAHKKK
jgi:acyl carrier protein